MQRILPGDLIIGSEITCYEKYDNKFGHFDDREIALVLSIDYNRFICDDTNDKNRLSKSFLITILINGEIAEILESHDFLCEFDIV
jgi:hypothetical protein